MSKRDILSARTNVAFALMKGGLPKDIGTLRKLSRDLDAVASAYGVALAQKECSPNNRRARLRMGWGDWETIMATLPRPLSDEMVELDIEMHECSLDCPPKPTTAHFSRRWGWGRKRVNSKFWFHNMMSEMTYADEPEDPK